MSSQAVTNILYQVTRFPILTLVHAFQVEIASNQTGAASKSGISVLDTQWAKKSKSRTLFLHLKINSCFLGFYPLQHCIFREHLCTSSEFAVRAASQTKAFQSHKWAGQQWLLDSGLRGGSLLLLLAAAAVRKPLSINFGIRLLKLRKGKRMQ